jgi:hypothetical protein
VGEDLVGHDFVLASPRLSGRKLVTEHGQATLTRLIQPALSHVVRPNRRKRCMLHFPPLRNAGAKFSSTTMSGLRVYSLPTRSRSFAASNSMARTSGESAPFATSLRTRDGFLVHFLSSQ